MPTPEGGAVRAIRPAPGGVRRALELEWLERLAVVYAAFGLVLALLALLLVGQTLLLLLTPHLARDLVGALVRVTTSHLQLLLGAAFGLAAWGFFRAAWCLHRRQEYGFCRIMTGLFAFFFPFGTIIAWWTFVLFRRYDVGAIFAAESAGRDRLA